jgi:hypothetical protein
MPKETEQDVPEVFQEVDIVDVDEDKLSKLVPTMNVSIPEKKDEENLVSDEALLGIYGEILTNLRDDRNQMDTLLNEFAEMVINGGDASTASKEALVNLVRAKVEASDKMSKVAELMTRVKLKERDTFPRYLAANQKNTINIGGGEDKKQLIHAINKKLKQQKKEEDKNE